MADEKQVIPQRGNIPLPSIEIEDFKGIRPDQAQFISAYMQTGDAGKAYEMIYPGVAEPVKKGRALLNTKSIKKLVAKQVNDVVVRELGSRNSVLAETIRIGTYDVRDLYDENGNERPINELPEAIARSIQAIEVEKDEFGNVIKQKYQFANKASVMNLLFKNMNLYQEDTEKSNTINHIHIGNIISGMDAGAMKILAEQGIIVDPSDPVKTRSCSNNNFDDIIDGEASEVTYDD